MTGPTETIYWLHGLTCTKS